MKKYYRKEPAILRLCLLFSLSVSFRPAAICQQRQQQQASSDISFMQQQAVNSRGANNNNGIFTNSLDIGSTSIKGTSAYLSPTEQYVVSGSGNNIWANHDAFRYICKKMTGDFILYARGGFAENQGVEEHRKLGWMIRSSLSDSAAQVSVAGHGDGLTALQFRRTSGANTEEIRSSVTYANILQLERKGNTFIMRTAVYGQPFVTEQVSGIDLGDTVYVGLFVCAHNADALETAVFRDVRITVPYTGNADQHTSMTLPSQLEILNVVDGSRKIVLTQENSIQGPNWTMDGKAILFNGADGYMYRFELAGRRVEKLNTGLVNHNNNDHVLSHDGAWLGLSSFVKELGGSIIYTVPVSGGTPRQVTPRGPSYLHGWSPDGKYLVYCADRNGEFDVYRTSVQGGGEERLTDTKGLDDGPEYTPGGQYIYFNSVRSGTMQIWRMRPDGSNQEPVTADSLYNWFAHISPDGKWMVFLSFLPGETEPGIHPPYKHVYLRLLPVNADPSVKPKVIAYFYGGQGSINVPSWAPDSKRLAFISNTATLGSGR